MSRIKGPAIIPLILIMMSCSSDEENIGWIEINQPTSDDTYLQRDYVEMLELSGESFALGSTTSTQCYCYDPTFISCLFGINTECVDYTVENRADIAIKNLTMGSNGVVLANGPFWSGATFLKPGENIIEVTASKGSHSGVDRLSVYADYDFTNLPTWVKIISIEKTNRGNGVAVDTFGNTHITGFSTEYGSLGTSLYAKYDISGMLLWSYNIPNTETSFYSLLGIDTDPEGSGYITGNIQDRNTYTYTAFTTKYDAAGKEEWTQYYSLGDYAGGTDIAVDNRGNSFVVGRAIDDMDYTGYAHVFVIKYATDGKLLWIRNIRADDGKTTHLNDFKPDIAVDQYGNSYITGNIYGNISCPSTIGNDVYVAKIDSNGQVKWISQFCEDLFNFSHAITVDNEGNSYITGHRLISASRRNYNILIARYDSLGNQTWVKTIPNTYVESGDDIAIDNDGVVHVVGWQYEDSGGTNLGYEVIDDRLFIGRYNTNGDEISYKEFLVPGRSSVEVNRISIDPQGHYSVLSSLYTKRDGSHDIYLMHFE